MLRIARLHFRLATLPTRIVFNRITRKRSSKIAQRNMLKNYEARLDQAIANVKLSQQTIPAN